MSFLINKEREQILKGDYEPKSKFTYMYALLKSQKVKKRKEVDYKKMSTSKLLSSKNYTKKLIEELKQRPFKKIIKYFESIPPLKNELYYWHPSKKINDPLTLLIKMYKQNDLLKKMRVAKCEALIFKCKGFDKFEGMLQERINMNELKVLNEDYNFFGKFWITRKGKTQEFYDYACKMGAVTNKNRKTVDVVQRIITHPYWCDNTCMASFSFLKMPYVKNLDFSVVECHSFLEIEIEDRTVIVSFREFNGLLRKDKKYEAIWNALGVTYEEEIEID
ncbi:hypothetical protein THOM_2900 [Trachipleistophora hominis]|uniref:Uncharacterized protein n=1 Tax=Trachipleistophora hominis TaxID=72359 RepID=L7JTY2_TRAHO|nr:hypothetical protein THOM_2900 [Trachipleistophora hominis]